MPIAVFPPGTAFNLPLQITQMDGLTPSTSYLSTDTLKTQLWAGDDQQLLGDSGSGMESYNRCSRIHDRICPCRYGGHVARCLSIDSQHHQRHLDV